MIIGLTGKYCSGKNHVGSILEKRGIPVLDVDKLGHQVLENRKQAVIAKFGADLEKADGSLDRRLLGQRVFGKPEKLAELEAITHPEINRLTDEWVANQNGHCVINAAILHKSPIFNKLDRIIIVKSHFLTRFLRARKRDKLTWGAILRRFVSQKDFDSHYFSINYNSFYAEIYIVGNPGFCRVGLSGSCKHKLEKRIDMILEGIT